MLGISRTMGALFERPCADWLVGLRGGPRDMEAERSPLSTRSATYPQTCQQSYRLTSGGSILGNTVHSSHNPADVGYNAYVPHPVESEE